MSELTEGRCAVGRTIDGLTEVIPRIEGQELGEIRPNPYKRNGFYGGVDEDGEPFGRAVPAVRPGPIVDVSIAGAGVPQGARLEAEFTNPDQIRQRSSIFWVIVSFDYVILGTDGCLLYTSPSPRDS